MTRPISDMTAEEFEDYFDEGGDVSELFEGGDVIRPNQTKKVNVDFTLRQVEELDAEAAYLGINRQAVIKTLCDEALTRRRAARRRAS